MSASVLFALASLFTAQELDAVAAGRFETSAGEVPTPGATATVAADGTVIEPPSLSTLAMEASPSVQGILTLRSARATLGYSPRIYYRVPLEEGEEENEPLLLHRLTLTYAHAIDRDVGLDISIAGSKGDLDYARATAGDLSGSPDLGTVPQDSIISITSLSGAVAVTKTFGASETLEFEVRPSYTEPTTSTVSTSQLRTSGDITYTNGISSRDELQLLVGTDIIYFDSIDTSTATDSTSRIYTARASARLEHSFNRYFSAHALAGVSTSLDPVRLLPLAELGLSYDIYRRGNLHLATALSAGLDTFASPLLGTFDGRFVSSFSFTIEIGSRIDILPSGSFFTTITEPDERSMALIGGGGVTESVLQGRLPVSYRIDDDVSFEIGLRASLRGPRIRDENFRLGQPEFVGYASVTASIDTRVPTFVR